MHPRHERYAKKVRPIIGAYYKYVQTVNKGEHQPLWRGVRVTKGPTDLILYAEAIFKNRPDYIVEAGTRFGGSALFFADVLNASGGKQVLTIDIDKDGPKPSHPLVTYITGSSTDPHTIDFIRRHVADRSVMVSLDSDHATAHVLQELNLYSGIVTPAQYMVVEDCYAYGPGPWPPHAAVEEFLQSGSRFTRHPVEEKYIFGNTRGGWLWKKEFS